MLARWPDSSVLDGLTFFEKRVDERIRDCVRMSSDPIDFIVRQVDRFVAQDSATAIDGRVVDVPLNDLVHRVPPDSLRAIT
jgi:hypothetical protein